MNAGQSADSATCADSADRADRADSSRGPLKYRRVVALVRDRIADGSLRPGQPAPSGAELARTTGYSTLTCRKALRVLIADGLLVPGPSRNARPRVAGAFQPQSERDLADATRALSAGLAARRHAAGLTQPELAALARVSVTTIGHAETGRVWQSRHFWERADVGLSADGDLLRLHDAYRAAGASIGQDQATSGGTESAADRSLESRPDGRMQYPESVSADGTGTGDADGRGGPSYVMIVWANGTVTTVHAPDVR
jgi:Helix-turn-helix domain/Bacterial regulatory proteins, gntR family